LTGRGRAWIVGASTKEQVMPGDKSREIPDYIAEYLLERALSQLPDEVFDVLVSLSREQIEGLALVGRAFDTAECEPHRVTFSIH
jgi:hypothetical protein